MDSDATNPTRPGSPPSNGDQNTLARRHNVGLKADYCSTKHKELQRVPKFEPIAPPQTPVRYPELDYCPAILRSWVL